MKDKKVIAYRNKRVKKIAFNLRTLIRKAVMDEWGRLGEEKRRIRSEGAKHKITPLSDWLEISRLKNEALVKCMDIEDERSDLYGALKASICMCSSCNQHAIDMVYNATLKEWYCILCVQEYCKYYQEEKAIYGVLGVDDGDFYETFL